MDAAILEKFIDVWVELAGHVRSPCHLCISFGYCPIRSPNAVAANAHKTILAHPSRPFKVAPLLPLSKDDIDDWPDTIQRHDPDVDEQMARRVARRVRRLIGDDELSMSELMDLIDEKGIDPKILEAT